MQAAPRQRLVKNNMAGYSKNIAVIKALRGGFSTFGANLSGLVKAEKYGSCLRAEISLINFAPLSAGRYVTAITDGTVCALFEGSGGEVLTEADTSRGFAAAICFVNGTVTPVAAAVCGDMAWAVPLAVREAERQEKSKPSSYEDEAIAEENYYEFDAQNATDLKKGGTYAADIAGIHAETISKDPAEDIAGTSAEGRHEKNSAAADGEGGHGDEGDGDVCERAPQPRRHGGGADEADIGVCEEQEAARPLRAAANGQKPVDTGGDMPRPSLQNKDADTHFYSRMKGEIDGIFSRYPREHALEKTVLHSRWARITYGSGHYVFGVIEEDGVPAYICYGVPAPQGRCPQSLKGAAGFIPDGAGSGYWVMYQSAKTGSLVKV